MSASFSRSSFVGALLLTLMSPLKSAEGSACLPFDTAPLPVNVGPFAMIAVVLSLLVRKKKSARIIGMSAMEAASSPVPTAVENKERTECERVKEMKSWTETNVAGHACGTNPPELIRSILTGDLHWCAISEAKFDGPCFGQMTSLDQDFAPLDHTPLSLRSR